MLHRDLKSANLLVDKHWRAKVADFNLSRVVQASAVESNATATNPRYTVLTSAGQACLPGACAHGGHALDCGRHDEWGHGPMRHLHFAAALIMQCSMHYL